MAQKKKRFSYRERYAVWDCNDRRCWHCNEPLRVLETTIDHVFPEWLLGREYGQERAEAFAEFSLPAHFNINGFENWLPFHERCNQLKGSKIPRHTQKLEDIVQKLIHDAHWVKRTAETVKENVTKDKILQSLFSALDRRKLTLNDNEEFLDLIIHEPHLAGVPNDVTILDDGSWLREENIVRKGMCTCDRPACVGSERRIFCYFEDRLSPWVIATGLYKECYDEKIVCPRCNDIHARGYVGREGSCAKPFANQSNQCD